MTEPEGRPWEETLLGDLRPEQRETVTCPLPLVVVQAGAGTGKTHTLSSRFAWLLASDPSCRVEQILTLTFTEKAAREMKERIRRRLAQWLAAEPRRLAHLEDGLRRLDEGYVSTLHAFALRVIRESGLLLDLDPEARIASSCGEEALFGEMEGALDRLDPGWFLRSLDPPWQDRCRQIFGEEGFPDLVNALSPRRLAELVRGTAELQGSRGWTPEDLWTRGPFAPAEAARDLAERLEAPLREIRNRWDGDLLPSLRSDLDATQLGRALGDLIDRSDSLPWDPPGDRAFLGLLLESLKGLPGKSKLKARTEEMLGEPLKGWRDRNAPLGDLARSVDQGLSEEEDRLLGRLCRLCALGWEAWDASRRRSGTLTFRDLIALAREALDRNPRYRERFRHLLVDEFQDTDPLQHRLVQALWAQGEEGRTLFLVGDLKQSIYRFRHADLTLFHRTIRQAREGRGFLGTLDCSYRTRGELLEGINGLFGDLWGPGMGEGIDLPYDPLRGPDEAPWWEERNRLPGPALEVLTASPRESDLDEEGNRLPKERVDDLRRRLYGELADRFRRMVDHQTPVWDKGMGVQRPCTWRDLAVLVPTRSDYPLLEEAFGTRGIPASFSAAVGFFTRGEVRDLGHLLGTLADPRDPLEEGGFLAGPFSGLPLGEVLPRLGKDPAGDPTLAPGLEVRRRLRHHALLEGGAAALETLRRDPSWLGIHPPEARRRVLGNLRAAADLAGTYEETFGPGLPGTAAYLGGALSRELPQPEPELLEEEDAVRVLTVHAAKGLEFPVVALVRLEKAPDPRGRDRVLPSRRLGLSLSSWPPGLEPPQAREIRSGMWERVFEEAGTREEWQRLLYVACTRAQDRLWLLGVPKGPEETPSDREGSWLEILRPRLGAQRVTEVPRDPMPGTPPSPAPSREPLRLLEPIVPSPAPLARLSATAFALFRFCPRAYRRRFRQGLDPAWESSDPLSPDRGGTDLGSLAHWALARWDGDPDTLDRWLPPEGPREETLLRLLPPDLRPPFRDRGIREALRLWLKVFAGSPQGETFRSVLASGGAQREASFRVPLGEVLLVGAADLLWEDKAQEVLYLRDHKTSRPGRAAEELYGHQLRFYGLAARLARGRTPDLALWPLRPDEEGRPRPSVPILPPQDWEAFAEEVRHTALQAASGPYPPATDRCGSCPWRRTCGGASKLGLGTPSDSPGEAV